MVDHNEYWWTVSLGDSSPQFLENGDAGSRIQNCH